MIQIQLYMWKLLLDLQEYLLGLRLLQYNCLYHLLLLLYKEICLLLPLHLNL